MSRAAGDKRLLELVERWKRYSCEHVWGSYSNDYAVGKEVAYELCANELENLLRI